FSGGATPYTLAGGTLFPAAGREEVFGPTYACDQSGNNNDSDKGCYARNDDAADTNDEWEMTKVHRLPKLGYDLNQTVSCYIRSGGQVYFVRTSPPTGVTPNLGDPTIRLRVELFRCTGTPLNNPDNECNADSERTAVTGSPKVFTYELVG